MPRALASSLSFLFFLGMFGGGTGAGLGGGSRATRVSERRDAFCFSFQTDLTKGEIAGWC